mgnify:CR=1 FL=1
MLEVGSDGRLPLGVFEERHKGAARDEAGGQARGLLLLFHASAIGALELRFSPDLPGHRVHSPMGASVRVQDQAKSPRAPMVCADARGLGIRDVSTSVDTWSYSELGRTRKAAVYRRTSSLWGDSDRIFGILAAHEACDAFQLSVFSRAGTAEIEGFQASARDAVISSASAHSAPAPISQRIPRAWSPHRACPVACQAAHTVAEISSALAESTCRPSALRSSVHPAAPITVISNWMLSSVGVSLMAHGAVMSPRYSEISTVPSARACGGVAVVDSSAASGSTDHQDKDSRPSEFSSDPMNSHGGTIGSVEPKPKSVVTSRIGVSVASVTG